MPDRLPQRWRATIASAAAPNSRTMGGAGTGAGGPPDVPDELDEVELDELVLLEKPVLLDP